MVNVREGASPNAPTPLNTLLLAHTVLAHRGQSSSQVSRHHNLPAHP